MLQSIRENLQGAVSYFIVGLIVVVFALFGAETLFQNPPSDSVIEVNGKSITERDVQRAVAMRKQQFQSMFGDNVDQKFLSEEFLRGPALDGLVQRRLLEGEAEEQNLAVARAILDEQIVSENMFQLEGAFDANYYRQLLRQSGYTPASYLEQLKTDYVIQQYQSAFSNSSFVTDKEISNTARIEFEKRSFEYITLPVEAYLDSVALSEEEILEYYENNTDNFVSEEELRVEYVELARSTMEKTVPVSEGDVEAEYESEIGLLRDKTERRAAHILIEVADDDSHQATITQIQQRLNDGEDFALLAKEFSTDTGSAETGGDVGFTQGDSFVIEFEEALAALEIGAVSEPVKTEFGYHIIKLLEVSKVAVPTLAESRNRIEQNLRAALAEELYVENLEALRDASFQFDDLSTLLDGVAIEGSDLQLQTPPLFSQRSANGILNQAAVMQWLFGKNTESSSEEVIELIEVNDTHAVLVKILERKMPEVKPLEQVRAGIVKTLTSRKAIAMANEQAEKIKASLIESGGLSETSVLEKGSLEKLAGEEKLQRQLALTRLRNDGEVARAILDQAFSAKKVNTLQHFQDDNDNVVLMNVMMIDIPALDALDEQQYQRLKDRLQSENSRDEFAMLQGLLASKAKIEQ